MHRFEADHRHHGRRGGDPEHPGAGGQSDGGHHPDARRRGEAADGVLVEDDQAGAQEAHARDHLRSHAGGVEALRVRESELGDHHEQGTAQAHQEVCADARLLRAKVTLQPDQGAQQAPDCDPQDHFSDCYHKTNIRIISLYYELHKTYFRTR